MFTLPISKYASNPVMEGGDTAHPEDFRGVRAPYFKKSSGTWYNFYSGGGTATTNPNWQVCLATSSDLITWAKQGVRLWAGGSKLGGYTTTASLSDCLENYLITIAATATTNGSADYIYIYTDGTATIKVGIFGNGDGVLGANHPGLLLASQNTGTNCVSGWNAIRLSSPLTVTSGSTYWLAYWYDKVAGDVQVKTSGVNNRVYCAKTYAAGTDLPADFNDWGASHTHDATNYDIIEMWALADRGISEWDNKWNVGGNPFQISTNVLAGCVASTTTHNGTANVALTRFVCSHTGSAAHFYVYCVHATKIKYGIYDSDPSGMPRTRLDYEDDATTVAAGANYIDLPGGALSLTAGQSYWLCTISDPTDPVGGGIGYKTVDAAEVNRRYVAKTYATWVWPAAWTDTTAVSAGCDCVALTAEANFTQWAMVYSGGDTTATAGSEIDVPTVPYSSALAVSDSLSGTWYKHPANPTFLVGATGQWDDTWVVISWVVENPTSPPPAGQKYLGFYSAASSTLIAHVGLAYTDDLINWTRDTTRVGINLGKIIDITEAQAHDPYIVSMENPVVFLKDGTWYMLLNTARGTFGCNTTQEVLWYATTFPTAWDYDGVALDSQKLIGQGDQDIAGSQAAQYQEATGWICATSGTATHIKLKCSISGNVKVAIYDDDAGDNGGTAGEPYTLLASTAVGVACVAGWNTIALDASVALTAGNRYYIAALADAACITNCILDYGDPGRRYRTDGAGTYAAGFPATWNETDTHDAANDTIIQACAGNDWDGGRVGMLATEVVAGALYLAYDASIDELHYGGKIGISITAAKAKPMWSNF